MRRVDAKHHPARPGRASRPAPAGAVRQGWCPNFVRRCTIGVNAKLSRGESSFNLRFSSDAPRNEFAGGERGDNRGTKCPDPKALLDGIQQRFFICVRELPSMVQRPTPPVRDRARIPHLRRFTPVPPFSPFPASTSQMTRGHAHAVRAYPVGVRKKRPLHSAFADRSVGKIGRQFSYKQNAEKGARLDETRRTNGRGSRGGRGRSCGFGAAWVSPGCREPFCGGYARSGAICPHDRPAGRCVRIRRLDRLRMSGRFSCLVPSASGVAPRQVCTSSPDRCVRKVAFSGFPGFLHPDDMAAAHRGGCTIVTAAKRRVGARCRGRQSFVAAAFHGKTSVGSGTARYLKY